MLSKTKKIIKRVAFFGDADAKPTDQHFIDTYNASKLLAENGYIIVNGGGPGVMLASTLGAKAGKGKVELVIIDEKVDMGEHYENSSEENKSNASKIYRTERIEDRTTKLIEIADAYIIMKGGTGTMAELSLVWEKAKFDYGNHEPVIFMGKFWHEVIETIVNDLDFDKIEKRVYEIVDTPKEVLEAINKVQE